MKKISIYLDIYKNHLTHRKKEELENQKLSKQMQIMSSIFKRMIAKPFMNKNKDKGNLKYLIILAW